MTIFNPNAFIDFINSNDTSKEQIAELSKDSIELIYKIRDEIESNLYSICYDIDHYIKSKRKNSNNEKEYNLILDIEQRIDKFECGVDFIYRNLQGFILKQLANINGMDVEINTEKDIVIIPKSAPKEADYRIYNSTDTNLSKSNMRVKYKVKFKNEKKDPDTTSYRTIIKVVFEKLLQNNMITQNEIIEKYNKYVMQNKENDGNYLEIKHTEPILYAKTQFKFEQFKEDVINKYDEIEVLESNDEFPTTCGTYKCVLNEDADLSVFGGYKEDIEAKLNNERVIYVGESNNINRRIYNNHLYKTRNSALRRSIAKLMNIDFKNIKNKDKEIQKAEEDKITDWLKKNTRFEVDRITNTKEEAKEREKQLKDNIYTPKPYFNKK